jgi:hypothetical protein
MVALGIVSAVVLGAINGILIAEAIHGRPPGRVIDDAMKSLVRRLRPERPAPVRPLLTPAEVDALALAFRKQMDADAKALRQAMVEAMRTGTLTARSNRPDPSAPPLH